MGSVSAMPEATVRHLRVAPTAQPKSPTPGVAHRFVATVRTDLGRWWLTTATPPSLTMWLANHTPTRVPGDDRALSWAWRVDHWVTGLPLAAASTALFCAAAALRWVACHPARRWLFLTLAAVCGTYLWLA